MSETANAVKGCILTLYWPRTAMAMKYDGCLQQLVAADRKQCGGSFAFCLSNKYALENFSTAILLN